MKLLNMLLITLNLLSNEAGFDKNDKRGKITFVRVWWRKIFSFLAEYFKDIHVEGEFQDPFLYDFQKN